MPWLEALKPYDFSPLTLACFLLAALGYGRALAGLPREAGPSRPQVLAFGLGLALCYAVMQTRFDYYAQYMFFVHRGQHLVLHHLGPFLVALSNPLPILRFWYACLGPRLRVAFRPLGRLYSLLQHPLIAPLLFVGLIFFWLWPEVHFDAMLSRQLYWIMNWSMLLDGLLFWWLILDPRPATNGHSLRFGLRILLLVLVAVPQVILGAWIALSEAGVYDVYEVCGRAWPLAAETDQILGGLLTWIPPAMMSILGILILLHRLYRIENRIENRTENRAAPLTAPNRENRP